MSAMPPLPAADEPKVSVGTAEGNVEREREEPAPYAWPHSGVPALRVALQRGFQYLFRMVPYPTAPRLIRIGQPGRRSPVLVTTNYDLTVRRVCRALRGLDCYLLVAPAGGLDVWCAAAGGRFSVDSIISIFKTSGIARLVDHRRLMLPQLAASGIDVFELKRRTGWTGIFGPARAEDVPEYFRQRRKTVVMTRVSYTLHERLEMAAAMWASLSLRYTLFPCLVFGAGAAPRFVGAVAVLSATTAAACFRLPGKTFVQKAGWLGILGVLATQAGLASAGAWTPVTAVEATVVFLLAAFLVGTAFPSYSPYWACGYSKLFYGSCDLQLTIHDEACIGCGICDRVCPVDCLELTPGRKMTFANPGACIGCGACLKQCPTNAIVNEVAEVQMRETACA